MNTHFHLEHWLYLVPLWKYCIEFNDHRGIADSFPVNLYKTRTEP